jgi:hypothetical protein
MRRVMLISIPAHLPLNGMKPDGAAYRSTHKHELLQ